MVYGPIEQRLRNLQFASQSNDWKSDNLIIGIQRDYEEIIDKLAELAQMPYEKSVRLLSDIIDLIRLCFPISSPGVNREDLLTDFHRCLELKSYNFIDRIDTVILDQSIDLGCLKIN